VNGAPTTLGGGACPVCAATADRAADAGGFSLYACADCGTWSSDALARGAKTSFAPAGYFGNAAADEPRWGALLDRVAARGGTVRTLLDVGCGTGAFLAFAGRRVHGARLTGIELDAERAAQARAANPGATVLAGDAAAVAAGLAGTYDLVTLWDVLEHVPEPGALLASLAGRLAPGGVLFVQTIHEDSIVPRLGRLSYRLTGGAFRAGLRRTHDAHHLVFFSRRGLRRLAQDAGLAVEAQWFDRLALARMDGNPLLTVPTALLMAAENALGNGLFVNALLARGA
jgi:2-polyprenyl-3-methyl-5-hydroxy-6-metoxy-1,4-benzoquinol methylase